MWLITFHYHICMNVSLEVINSFAPKTPRKVTIDSVSGNHPKPGRWDVGFPCPFCLKSQIAESKWCYIGMLPKYIGFLWGTSNCSESTVQHDQLKRLSILCCCRVGGVSPANEAVWYTACAPFPLSCSYACADFVQRVVGPGFAQLYWAM